MKLERGNAGECAGDPEAGGVAVTFDRGDMESETRFPVVDGEGIEAAQNIEDPMRVLVIRMEELHEDLRRYAQDFDHQRTLLDKLHHENEQLRCAELERSRDPVVRDLISLADTCLRNGRAWGQRDVVTPDDVYRVLREVADDVELILERQGVETFTPETGTNFDRREHRVVRSVDTSDALRNGVIAEILKPGYRIGNRILRYCEVVVWVFVAAPVGPTGAEDTGNAQSGEYRIE